MTVLPAAFFPAAFLRAVLLAFLAVFLAALKASFFSSWLAFLCSLRAACFSLCVTFTFSLCTALTSSFANAPLTFFVLYFSTGAREGLPSSKSAADVTASGVDSLRLAVFSLCANLGAAAELGLLVNLGAWILTIQIVDTTLVPIKSCETVILLAFSR